MFNCGFFSPKRVFLVIVNKRSKDLTELKELIKYLE